MKDQCIAKQATLSAHLDGRLTPAEAEECAEHLRSCARCRVLYERLAAARALLRSMPPPEAPEDLLPAILAGIERETSDEALAVELLRTLPSPSPPRELLPAIMTAAAAEMRSTRTTEVFWGRWRVAAVAVAAAAALLLAVLLPRGMNTHPELAQSSRTMSSPSDLAAVADEAPVAVDAAPVEVAAVAAVTPVAVRRGVSRSSSQPVRSEAVSESEEMPPAPVAPVEPVLAVAPIAASAEALSAAVPIGPGEPAAPGALALAPRNTVADTDVQALAVPEPSGLETEIAAGIVAGMMVDKFVTEHLIESAPTLLAVVTDTPSSQLGSVAVAEGEDAGFTLCFTESMRRALSATENQFR